MFQQRLLTSVKAFKARLADLFIHFVILPDSNLRLIKYINCLFVFATTLTITYMVSKTCGIQADSSPVKSSLKK